MSMRLYTHERSGNAQKVRLLLGFLGLEFEETSIDIPAGEQHGPTFTAIAPLGQVPVLEDYDVRLRDSQAILIYLGGAYGRGAWWPIEARAQGLVAQWLSFAALELQTGLNLSRLNRLLGAPCDMAAALAQGARTLRFLENHLSHNEWLELGRPTVADCACAPYVALAGEAGHDLGDYHQVTAWISRIEGLPGFKPMLGWGA